MINNKKVAPAVKLFRAFHGERPQHIDKIILPEYEVLLNVGPLTHIAYIAEDGKNYMHRFKVKSRPDLATDGKHLVILGGKFRFNDRGIVDT